MWQSLFGIDPHIYIICVYIAVFISIDPYVYIVCVYMVVYIVLPRGPCPSNKQ